MEAMAQQIRGGGGALAHKLEVNNNYYEDKIDMSISVSTIFNHGSIFKIKMKKLMRSPDMGHIRLYISVRGERGGQRKHKFTPQTSTIKRIYEYK